jgi:hypothetical protein
VVALAALTVAATALGAGPRRTSVLTFQAFSGGELRSSIVVDETLSGSCSGSSKASPRRDAWRCSVADDTYDPCFSDPSGTADFVVCPEFGLTPRRVDRINLGSPLPSATNTAAPGTRKGLPFVMLARPYAGYCDRIAGRKPPLVQGRRPTYDCGLGGTLLGPPDRSGSRWTAHLITAGDNPTIYTVGVRIAWY